MSKLNSPARRQFVKTLGQAGSLGVLAPWAVNLAAIGQASAASASDYKALVCVLLEGGNDPWNTLVPYDGTSYGAYAQHRAGLATSKELLFDTALPEMTGIDAGRSFALAPELADLKTLYDKGRLGIVLNTGSLVVPTTKEQYRSRSVPLPPKLFSHNDQKSFIQSSQAEGALEGWGARLIGQVSAKNPFASVYLYGSPVWGQSHSVAQYNVTTDGPVPINVLSQPLQGSPTCSEVLRTLVTRANSSSPLERALVDMHIRSIWANTTLTGALSGAMSPSFNHDPTNPLAAQLKMVAHLIAARQSLGVKRQIFFVGLGGFDTHSAMATTHPKLLGQLNEALVGFDSALVAMGLANAVTTFTATDFGRGLSSNGDGVDHGWGGVQFISGGAVRGGLYGRAPVVAVDGPDTIGNGRLLPTTAVSQVAASLGRWFGGSPTQINEVFTGLSNFDAFDVFKRPVEQAS